MHCNSSVVAVSSIPENDIVNRAQHQHVSGDRSSQVVLELCGNLESDMRKEHYHENKCGLPRIRLMLLARNVICHNDDLPVGCHRRLRWSDCTQDTYAQSDHHNLHSYYTDINLTIKRTSRTLSPPPTSPSDPGDSCEGTSCRKEQ